MDKKTAARRGGIVIVFLFFVVLVVAAYFRFEKSKPVDCELTSWSKWKGCHTAGCPAGEEIRVRGVKRNPSFGGKSCPGKASQYVQVRQCKNGTCKQNKGNPDPGGGSKDCIYQEWSKWSPCPSCKKQNCNFPLQYRTRSVKKPPKKGGRPCRWQEMVETRVCNKKSTPVCASKQKCTFGDTYQLKHPCPRGIICLPKPLDKNNSYKKVYQKPVKKEARNGGKCNIAKHQKTEQCVYDACPSCPPPKFKCHNGRQIPAYGRCSYPCMPPNAPASRNTKWAPRQKGWSPLANLDGQCPQFLVRTGCCSVACPTSNNPNAPACWNDTDVEMRVRPEYRASSDVPANACQATDKEAKKKLPQDANAYEYRVIAPLTLQHRYPHVFRSSSTGAQKKGTTGPEKSIDNDDNDPAALTSWKPYPPTSKEMHGSATRKKLYNMLQAHGITIA